MTRALWLCALAAVLSAGCSPPPAPLPGGPPPEYEQPRGYDMGPTAPPSESAAAPAPEPAPPAPEPPAAVSPPP